LTHGSFGPPDPAECSLNRHLIELAIWMHAELTDRRQQVAAALPRVDRRGRMSPVPVQCRLLSPPTAEGESAGIEDLQPAPTLSPADHLRRRLRRPSDACELAIRLAWSPQELHVLLTPRGPASDAFWDDVRCVTLDFGFPRAMVHQGAADLPPLLAFLEWLLAADPREPHLRCEVSPYRGYDRHTLADTRIVRRGPHCLLVIPWPELAVRPPEPSEEFGLGLSVHDRDGGRLEWVADRQWARIVVVT
jgi:hypothetical protein